MFGFEELSTTIADYNFPLPDRTMRGADALADSPLLGPLLQDLREVFVKVGHAVQRAPGMASLRLVIQK